MSIVKLNNISTRGSQSKEDLSYVATIVHSDSGLDEPTLVTTSAELDSFYGDFDYKEYFRNLLNDNIPIVVTPLLYKDFRAEKASLRSVTYLGKPTSNYKIINITSVGDVTWNHNLGYYPKVMMISNSGNRSYPRVRYDSKDSLTLLNITSNELGIGVIDVFNNNDQYTYTVGPNDSLVIPELPTKYVELVAARYYDNQIITLAQDDYSYSINDASNTKSSVTITNNTDSYIYIYLSYSFNSVVATEYVSNSSQLNIQLDRVEYPLLVVTDIINNEVVTVSSTQSINSSTIIVSLNPNRQYKIIRRSLPYKLYENKLEPFNLICHPKLNPSHIDESMYNGSISSQVELSVESATVFDYNHNLGYYPKLIILDQNGLEVHPDIYHVSKDEFVIQFDSEFTGSIHFTSYDIGDLNIECYDNYTTEDEALSLNISDRDFEYVFLDSSNKLIEIPFTYNYNNGSLFINSSVGGYHYQIISYRKAINHSKLITSSSEVVNHELGIYPRLLILNSNYEVLPIDSYSLTYLDKNSFRIDNAEDAYIIWDNPYDEQVSQLYNYDERLTWNYIIDLSADNVGSDLDKFWITFPLSTRSGIQEEYSVTTDQNLLTSEVTNIYIPNPNRYLVDPNLVGDYNGINLSRIYSDIKQLIDQTDSLNKIENIIDIISDYFESLSDFDYYTKIGDDYNEESLINFKDKFINDFSLYDFRLFEAKYLLKSIIPIIDELFSEYIDANLYPSSQNDLLNDLLHKISTDFYNSEYHTRLLITSSYQTDGKVLYRGARYNEQLSEYFNSNQVESSINYNYNQDVLGYLTENYKTIDFYSKIYGSGGNKIKVNISRLKSYDADLYKILIDNDVIKENYLVCTNPDRLIESNDYISPTDISRLSKLVDVKYYDYLYEGKLYDQKDINISDINYNPENVISTELVSCDDYLRRVYPIFDLSMIDKSDVVNTISRLSQYNYYPELLLSNYLYNLDDLTEIDYIKLLIDYAKSKYTQIIQRIPYSNTLFLSNLITTEYKSILTNSENRILLFYDDIQIDGITYPSSYPYVVNILSDNYLGAISINLIAPLRGDLSESFREYLEERNVNYIKYNDLEYYYTELDEFRYDAVFIMRFLLSRLSRNIMKNKLNLLTLTGSDLKEVVNEIATNTADTSSYIKSIDTEVVVNNKSANIKCSVDMPSLVNKTYNVDIIIDY